MIFGMMNAHSMTYNFHSRLFNDNQSFRVLFGIKGHAAIDRNVG